MNPHSLARLSSPDLCAFFSSSLEKRDHAGARDALAQIETRFHRLSLTHSGSRQFLGDFLDLAGRAEVRARHISDPLIECVARLEYLLELAGEHARSLSQEDVLRQIVSSRERGRELMGVLASAPGEGLTNKEIAARLEVSLQNLSPLLSSFHGHGLVDRVKRGSSIFNLLTPQARALFSQAEVPVARIEYRFGGGPVNLRKLAA
jgi:DNA-binding MarR family transcriptional regulator